MKRFCYRAQYRDEEALRRAAELGAHVEGLLREEKLLSATVFGYDARNLFFYYECAGETLEPGAVFPGLEPYLCGWPGEEEPRYFLPMTELYHSYAPDGEEQAAWRRQTPVEPVAMMSRMVPEKLASYIFYHFQRQEEQPASEGRHLSIWGDGATALLYDELPELPVAHPRAGLLAPRHHTPENWREIMLPHFRLFEDGEVYHNARVLLTRSHADL